MTDERADQVRDAALEEAAKVASWAHMVPPDGGSPTEEECIVAARAASAIRALASKPQASADVVEALGNPAGWTEAQRGLQKWCSSAFLAGDGVEDDEACKAELYSFLCALLGYLVAGEEAATALASQPAPTGVETTEALNAAMVHIAAGLHAINAAFEQADAEFRGHDRRADKADKIVSAWRNTARAMLDAAPAEKGER